MKKSQQLTKTARTDLKKLLALNAFHDLQARFQNQQKSGFQNDSNDKFQAGTPSTIDTTFRRRGNAIVKSTRPESKSKLKVKSILQGPRVDREIAVTTDHEFGILSQQVSNQSPLTLGTASRRVLSDRAVYYGDVELPYLHSSDALSSLYQRPKAQQRIDPEPLINPPSSISPHLLTCLKNLYLYYTPLDSLRQLGTGWSNLKSLTVMCSYQLVDLAGLSIFPSLQFLFVPHNNIREISDLMYHSTLKCVDLQDNCIDLMDQIEYLYTINTLEWVDVSQNQVTLVKEKYRIICENLATKIQLQECNKPFEYQMGQIEFDQQVYSYDRMEVSNNLVREINEQINKEQIKIGQHWRAAYLKRTGQQLEPDADDVQIIESFKPQQDEPILPEQTQAWDAREDKVTLRVTPLAEYVQSSLNIAALSKYFQNKVCPPTKPEKNTGNLCNDSNVPQQGANSIQFQEMRKRKFAATQKLSSAAVSEDKKRLTSLSLRKKVTKIFLSKNFDNLPSTASTVLSGLKSKQQFSDANMGGSSNLKFLGKRKLLSKLSQDPAFV